MQKLGLLLLVLTSLLYPLAVYAGLGRTSPVLLAAVLAASWMLRLTAWRGQQARPWTLAALVLAYCSLLVWQPWPGIERWYPCLINLALALGFAASLHRGMPAIERLARLQEPDLPAAGVRYTRRVTWLWLGFFILNGSIAAGLSLWGSLHWWALYNGGVAYLLMGLLFVLEYGMRCRLRRRQAIL